MSATVEITLLHGLKAGEQVHKKVVVRELRAGDIIDATQESERLVETAAGPVLVASPGLVGIHTLRRQIKSIGDIDGPLSLVELRLLHPVDLDLIQEAANKLEAASVQALEASRKVAQKGRSDGAPAAD